MDEKRDPAAELAAQCQEIAESFRPLFDQTRAIMDAANRAGEVFLEQQRPLFQALGKLGSQPVRPDR